MFLTAHDALKDPIQGEDLEELLSRKGNTLG